MAERSGRFAAGLLRGSVRRRLRHGSRAGGFTLVELLVSIVVVTILTTLAIGSIERLRSRSTDLKCVSKMRSLSGMFQLYALENDLYYPAVRMNNATETNPAGESWMMVIQNFMQIRFPKENQDSFLECPSAREQFPGGIARRNYAMNHAGTGNNTVPIRPDELRLPAQTVLLVDSAYNPGMAGSGDSFSSVGISDYPKNIDWRHSGGTHVLFYDGHVENVARADTVYLERILLNYMQRQ